MLADCGRGRNSEERFRQVPRASPPNGPRYLTRGGHLSRRTTGRNGRRGRRRTQDAAGGPAGQAPRSLAVPPARGSPPNRTRRPMRRRLLLGLGRLWEHAKVVWEHAKVERSTMVVGFSFPCLGVCLKYNQTDQTNSNNNNNIIINNKQKGGVITIIVNSYKATKGPNYPVTSAKGHFRDPMSAGAGLAAQIERRYRCWRSSQPPVQPPWPRCLRRVLLGAHAHTPYHAISYCTMPHHTVPYSTVPY